MQILLNEDVLVSNWVGERIGIYDFGPCTTIGVVEGDRLIAGVVYSQYQPLVPSIEASCAADSRRWATRPVLDAIFRYPFETVEVERIQLSIGRKNKHTRRFCEKLGFTYEGMGRKAGPGGQDLAVYSMLRHECRWIGELNGQELTLAPACT